jgi:hypothetical protein
MSYAHQLLSTWRRRLAVALLAAAAAAALISAFQGSAARAEGGCISERFCGWTGTFFSGEEFNSGCGASVATNFELKSAKNRCKVNIRIGWEEGGVINWKACLSPGGERPEPGRFNRIVPNAC